MSLYFRYIKESRGLEHVGGENGFITFVLHPEECFIEDVFIEEEYRKLGVGSKLMDMVRARAKQHGCKSLLATVSCRVKNPEVSLMSSFHYGFKVLSAAGDMIVIKMEI